MFSIAPLQNGQDTAKNQLVGYLDADERCPGPSARIHIPHRGPTYINKRGSKQRKQ